MLAALRRAWPDAHIAWLVGTSFAPLLDGHPLLNEVIRFDRRTYGRMWRDPRAFIAFWRLVLGIRRRRFDLVIDLQGLIRSGLIGWFSGARRRIGFAEAREFAWMFYSHRVRCPLPEEHAVHRNLRLVEALGLPPESSPEFPLPITPEELDNARPLLRSAGVVGDQFCAVLIGARWESKRWPGAHFAELLKRLGGSDAAPAVLLGAPDERAAAAEAMPTPIPNVHDLVGTTTLRQLVALLKLATRVVCLDSGPMHIAAALNRPTVALFGPTNPARTGPLSDAARVLTHPVPCAPCYRRRCPLGHQNCLRNLSPEAVFAHVLKLPAANPSDRLR